MDLALPLDTNIFPDESERPWIVMHTPSDPALEHIYEKWIQTLQKRRQKSGRRPHTAEPPFDC